MSDWYEEKKQALQEEQADKSREQVIEDLRSKQEYVFDPDTAPKQKHVWVDRGLKLSCEGASHPHHQAWKRKRMY